MFKPPEDKPKNKKSNQANLGNHLVEFGQDLFFGGNKQDIDSTFKPSSWVNKPKDQPGSKNKNNQSK